MNQQINLYQPIFRRERKLLSLQTVLIALSMVLVTLLALYGFSWHRVNLLAKDVQSVRHRLEMQQEMVAKMSGQITAQASPEQIQAGIKQMSLELADRTRALQLLRDGVAGGTTGFADRMEALARNNVDGLWLDRLSIVGGGDAIGGLLLEGRAINAALLPAYLQQLAGESALSGVLFDQLVIDRYASREAAEQNAKATSQQPANSNAEEQSLATTIRFSVSNSRALSEQSKKDKNIHTTVASNRESPL
jgi:hypothetical protein